MDVEELELCGTEANFFSMDRSNIFGESTFYTIRDKRISAYYRLYKSSSVPDISADPSKFLVARGTVMNIMLQFAMYFGFSTIVLYGFDATVVDSAEKDVIVEKNHFYDKAFDDKYYEQMRERYVTTEKGTVTNDMITAGEVAKKYADLHGIRILNATHGGKLEVFQRVDFSSMFREFK
jgi:hypothetical protein